MYEYQKYHARAPCGPAQEGRGASENDTTINALVKELLAQKLTGSARTEAAIRRFLAITDEGPLFKGDLKFSREELYKR